MKRALRTMTTMFRFRMWLLLAALQILGSGRLLAATYYVGSCHSGSFATISEAVSSVPPGSTVKVCPGGYQEQVTITQPLTLEGISSGNYGQVNIVPPASGDIANVFTVTAPPYLGASGYQLCAQVLVQNAGPVNISNIAVNMINSNCGNLAGIFYASGSSGTLNQVSVQSVTTSSATGVGIWAENGNGTSESVTIENSSVSYVDNTGIFVASSQTPPTLTATVKGNSVNMKPGSMAGIAALGSAGTMANNIVSGLYAAGPNYAIYDASSLTAVTSNVLINPAFGILVAVDGATIKSNSIVGAATYGIWLNGSNTKATVVESNNINSSVGIEFSCNMGTVSGNTISAGYGLDSVPAGSTGSNVFVNTPLIKTGC